MKESKVLILIIVWMVSHSVLYGQNDSIPEKKSCKATKVVGIALPSAMITYGIISLGNNGVRQIDYNVHHSLEQNNRFWHISAEDYIQFAPAVAAYALKFCKVENAHNLLDMTVLYGLSNLVAGGIVQSGKFIIGRERPDNSDSYSFPSGHTETAFVAAEFLHQEYKNQSIWISAGGYAAATFVGVARVYNNKHWVSDVVTGAGIGILSTKAVYWVYPYLQKIYEKKFGKKDKPLHTLIFPEYSNGSPGLALSCVF
jgi:membrane-associated phospholipid phosphatase